MAAFSNPRILEHLRSAIPGLLAVYAFGSQVQGTAGPASDLDLAVLKEGKLPPEQLWQLAGDLAALLNTEVDLVDLRSASTVMQHQIVTTGQRLWARDNQAALYESFILSEKTALDERRAELLADIAKDGRIHGR